MKICLRCGARFQYSDFTCPTCQFTPETHQRFFTFAPDLLGNNTEYEADFFDALIQLEKGNFWFEARNQLLLWVFAKFFPQARHFLEIGCGTGFVLAGFRKTFPNLHLSGSDLFVEGLAYAQRRSPEATLFQMDARQIPFVEEFDVIGAFDVIEHIDEDTAVLKQMFSAVKPGGGIILTVPQHRFLWSYMDDYSHHKRRYTRSDLRQKVTGVGFEVLYATSFVSLLLPAMLLARIQRKKDENFNAMSEFQISPHLNAMLHRVMHAEHRLTRLGITFPAGGSLLMVGRKTATV